MKKIISLFTMMAVLFGICGVLPITASAMPVDAWGNFGALTKTLTGSNTKFTSYSEFESFKNEYNGHILFDTTVYDEGFFENYNLYLLTVNENDSGSSIYDVLKINYGSNGVDIEVTKTQQGVTDDVVAWYYIYALNKNYPQDKVKLIYKEDLSQCLDSLFFGEYRFTEADEVENFHGCYIAKVAEYADIEKYSWASKYDKSFFENNFLLAVSWSEGIPSDPPIYSIRSLKRTDNNVEIEIRQDRDVEFGPTVVCTYICIIELPKDMYNMEYNILFNDWIMLYDENDIKKFADDVNSGNTYEGKTVVLGDDIDLSTVCGKNINGAEVSWEPIGADNGPTDSMPNIFNGTFDGSRYTISSLYINSSYGDYTGLFGHTGDKAAIKNLTVDGYVSADTDTNKSCYAGAIAGHSEGVIENCHNKAAVSVSGGVIAGGIVGNNGGAIEKCYNSGAISTDSYLVGGICGRNLGAIKNSYNTGAVSGDLLIGGVCAQVLSGSIHNCFNIGKIAGNECVGGILGNDVVSSIENCYYLSGCNAEGTAFDVEVGTAKTAEQFADKTNFANWDFDRIWKMDETLKRPVLRLNREHPPTVPHTHKICGDENCVDKHEDIEWTAWDSADTLPTEAGNYYLTKDVTLSEHWKSVNKEINICMNGHIITVGGYTMYAASETTFTDCTDTIHKFSVADNGLWSLDEQNGTETVTGGVITGGKLVGDIITSHSTVAILSNHILNMYNINIIGNQAKDNGYSDDASKFTYGGGVSNGGTFNMYSGKIIGNTADYGGGVNNVGIFNMTGGEISGNIARYNGGGIDNTITFNMTGGKIINNTAGREAGGVNQSHIMTIGGTAIIKDNNGSNLYVYEYVEEEKEDYNILFDENTPLTDGAYIGITCGYTAQTEGNPVDITGANDADYSKYFHSDDENYKIINGENNVIRLVYKNNVYPYYKITDVRAMDAERNTITTISANTEFTAYCYLEQIAALEGTNYGTVIFAVYDKDGAIIDIGIDEITNPEYFPCAYTASLHSDERAVASIKVFVWDRLNSMIPLAETNTLTFTE